MASVHGSGSNAVVDLIMTRTICLPCLARKTGLVAERVTEILTDVMKSLTIAVTDGACEECFERTVVHRLG
jgi:hypothetical protein